MTVTSRVEMKSFMPPAGGFTSRFISIQDWLLNICDTEQPEKSIDEYKVHSNKIIK